MTWDSWPTAITRIEPGIIAVRGYRLEELMGRVSFAEAIVLTLTGELPDAATSRLVDALLVSAIDHGVTSPSAMATRQAATAGAEVTVAATAGLLAVSLHHGAAVGACMRFLEEVVRQKGSTDDPEAAAYAVVEEWHQRAERIPGFGHRVHPVDPRVGRLFAIAAEAGLSGIYVNAARAAERALGARLGRAIPLNLDGAIAAVLCAIGFPSGLANSLFAVSRFVGLNAHAFEEKSRMRPMRVIRADLAEYDGPRTPRPLSAKLRP